MACLDTTLLIDLSGSGGRRQRARARAKLSELLARDETLVTTRLNVAELWVGVEGAVDPEGERIAVQRLLAPLAILELDEPSARAFGGIVAHLRRRGASIGDMDALIAAVALSHGHAVVTRNERHFGRVPGLIVESY